MLIKEVIAKSRHSTDIGGNRKQLTLKAEVLEELAAEIDDCNDDDELTTARSATTTTMAETIDIVAWRSWFVDQRYGGPRLRDNTRHGLARVPRACLHPMDRTWSLFDASLARTVARS
jgi:hypothetical protein